MCYSRTHLNDNSPIENWLQSHIDVSSEHEFNRQLSTNDGVMIFNSMTDISLYITVPTDQPIICGSVLHLLCQPSVRGTCSLSLGCLVR